jgi:hypothetical protein
MRIQSTRSVGARRRPDWWRNAITKLFHAAFYLAVGAAYVWLPAWLVTGNVAFLVSIIAANVVIADLLVRVHDAIHYAGSHRWLRAGTGSASSTGTITTTTSMRRRT